MKFLIEKTSLTTPEFLNYLVEQFPSVKEEVLDPFYEGLIHLQVARFADYTNHCIKVKKLDELQRILDFFRAVIDKVDSGTENALYVSFLEHLEFEGLKEREIRQYLGEKHFKEWKELRKFLGL